MRLDWLGTLALSWRDLLVIVNQLPRTSALARAMNPEAAQWGSVEHLLAAIFDSVEWGNWQRSNNPHAPRPKPTPRPGITEGQKYGGKPVPMDEMARLLGWEVNDGG